MNYEEAVFEVYCWQYSNTNCFNQKLLNLFQAADNSNKMKLRSAYPELFQAFKAWEESGDNGDDLFREFSLIED